MSRYYPIVPLFCGLLLSGCAKIPDKIGLYQEPPSPWAIEQNNASLPSAVSNLAITETGQLGVTDKIKYFQSQAFAYSLTGNLLESTNARIALDAFLAKPDGKTPSPLQRKA